MHETYVNLHRIKCGFSQTEHICVDITQINMWNSARSPKISFIPPSNLPPRITTLLTSLAMDSFCPLLNLM